VSKTCSSSYQTWLEFNGCMSATDFWMSFACYQLCN
jgi:hypothetical protein